jgi:hypothetical protein
MFYHYFVDYVKKESPPKSRKANICGINFLHVDIQSHAHILLESDQTKSPMIVN